MKTCRRCGVEKSFDQYHGSDRGADKLQAYCKPCKNEYNKFRRRINPRPGSQYSRKQQLRKFGLTIESYDTLLREQGGGCAICGKMVPPSSAMHGFHDGAGALHVDHDHRCCADQSSCGSCRRGLLCPDCNLGLGRFSDDPTLLRLAADYLEKYAK